MSEITSHRGRSAATRPISVTSAAKRGASTGSTAKAMEEPFTEGRLPVDSEAIVEETTRRVLALVASGGGRTG